MIKYQELINKMNINDEHSDANDIWNDFRNEENYDNILEASFNVSNWKMINYLIDNYQNYISLEINGAHLIFAMLTKIQNGQNNDLLKEQKVLINKIISTLKPPIDRDYNQKFNVLKELINIYYIDNDEEKNRIIFDIIQNILQKQDMLFIESINQERFNELITMIKEMNDEQKKDKQCRMFKLIHSSIIKYNA